MNINKDYLFGTKELNMMSLSKMTPIGITIHNTYNSAAAINEAKNQFNNNTKKGSSGVAVHFYVDEKDIYQLLPLDYHGWHAGDGANGNGNRKTIAIEICRSRDYETDNYKKAEELTVSLVQMLMKDLNINSDGIYKHQDWSGKKCPHRMLEGNPRPWNDFIALISNANVTPPVDKSKTVDQMAQEVINGKHGTGHANRQASLGVDDATYTQVRDRVNEIVYGAPIATQPTKSIDQMAREVIDLKHGYGHSTRKKSLGVDDATYEQVRARVNQLV